MFRRSILCVLAMLIAQAAFAQTSVRPVQWISRPDVASQAAQKSLKPMLVLVTADSQSRNTNLENRQQRALRDPLFIELVNSRFVPVRLARTSQTRPMLDAFGLPSTYGGYMAVLPPDAFASPQTARRIAMLDWDTTANPQSLVQALTGAFRQYRSQLYSAHIQPIFEAAVKDGADLKDLKQPLAVVNEFIITDADELLIKLAEKAADEKKSTPVLKAAYETLGTLSTQKSGTFLFERAVAGDKDAARWLENCSPDIADTVLLPALTEKDAKFYTAYEAIVKICKIQPLRQEKWWQNANEKMRADELEKVRTAARTQAEQWRMTFGALR